MSSQMKGLESGNLLPVMEMFYSIQGEGYNTGKAASFIRIGGCDVGCHWCDVKESWDASSNPLTQVDLIVDFVLLHPARSVVITGGEPLMYNLDILCRKLKDNNITIFLETSGTYPLTGFFDWICLSPKAQTEIRPEIIRAASELKVIIHNEEDFRQAEKFGMLINNECLLYLQPEWSRHKYIIPKIVEYILNNPKWMISIQSHKYMQIP